MRSFLTKRSQLNNGGYSLVEVLVAVVVLAIISVTLTRGFASAARTNAAAKKIQDATDLAQSTAEQFDAKTLDDLETNKSGLKNFSFTKFADTTNSGMDDQAGIEIFEFEDTSYSEDFHVMVVMNPYKYEDENKESAKTPVLDNMYSNKSVYWMKEFSKHDTEGLAKIKQITGNNSLDSSNVVRTCNITMKFTNGTNGVYDDNNVTLEYTLETVFSYTDASGNSYQTDSYLCASYTTVFSKATLNAKALYLMYTPYNNSAAPTDQIHITCDDQATNWNATSKAAPVFFVLQSTSDDNLKFTAANFTLTNDQKTMQFHSNIESASMQQESLQEYPLTTGGNLENAESETIYECSVYVFDKDSYDPTVKRYSVKSSSPKTVDISNYFTVFTTTISKQTTNAASSGVYD